MTEKSNIYNSSDKYPMKKIFSEDKNDEKNTISIEDLAEFGDKALGLKVIIKSKKHSTLGVVSYILSDCKRLALEKASNPKTGKIQPGLVIYLFYEILSVTIVGEDGESRKNLLKFVCNKDQKGRKVMARKVVPHHLLNEEGYENEETLDEDMLLGKTEPPLLEVSSLQPVPSPPPGINRPEKWIIINTIDEAYHEAVS